MKRLIFALVVLSGCAHAPSQEEVNKHDYGPAPTGYRQQINDILKANLFDPFSAVIEVGTPEKGWYYENAFADTKFSWNVGARMNAKNRMGGYVGWHYYTFCYQGEKLVYYFEHMRY